MTGITPQEQKAQLLEDIDTAIMAQAAAYGCSVEMFERRNQGSFAGDNTNIYDFHVPPNIEYNVIGSQLFYFKKQVKRIFPNKKPALFKPTKYGIRKPLKRNVSRTKTYQSIIDYFKPLDLKAADIDPALLRAMRYDMGGGAGNFVTGTPTFIGFINWLLEHPLTPAVFEKLKRSFVEKDFKLEILRQELEDKKGYLGTYIEDQETATADFEAYDAIRNKIDNKELTLKAAGIPSYKALCETHSRKESLMLSENTAASDLRRDITILEQVINERGGGA